MLAELKEIQSQISGVIYRNCPNDGDDVMQEVAVKLLQGKDSYTKLRAICTAKNFRRSQFRREMAHKRAFSYSVAASRPDVEAEQSDLIQAVLKHVAKLDDVHRSVIELRYLQEKSVEEIASVMGVTTRTVYLRLKDALEVLRSRV